MKNMSSTPTPQLIVWLGYGGLIPFISLAVGLCWLPQQHDIVEKALLAYGAVILGFVGALHWGFAMTLHGLSVRQRQLSYVWSVVPALLAWLALVLDSVALGSGLLIFGFVANYWRDVCLVRVAELQDWYLPLRLRLTLMACLCLMTLVFPRSI